MNDDKDKTLHVATNTDDETKNILQDVLVDEHEKVKPQLKLTGLKTIKSFDPQPSDIPDTD